MKVLEFAFVGYPVTDLQRSRDFYENVLGFSPNSTWGDEKTGWVEYEIGPHTLAITNSSRELWKASSNGPAVALEVEDFDESMKHLRQNGVTFTIEPTTSPICRLAVITDPDGNSIAIHKRNPQ